MGRTCTLVYLLAVPVDARFLVFGCTCVRVCVCVLLRLLVRTAADGGCVVYHVSIRVDRPSRARHCDDALMRVSHVCILIHVCTLCQPATHPSRSFMCPSLRYSDVTRTSIAVALPARFRLQSERSHTNNAMRTSFYSVLLLHVLILL